MRIGGRCIYRYAYRQERGRWRARGTRERETVKPTFLDKLGPLCCFLLL